MFCSSMWDFYFSEEVLRLWKGESGRNEDILVRSSYKIMASEDLNRAWVIYTKELHGKFKDKKTKYIGQWHDVHIFVSKCIIPFKIIWLFEFMTCITLFYKTCFVLIHFQYIQITNLICLFCYLLSRKCQPSAQMIRRTKLFKIAFK